MRWRNGRLFSGWTWNPLSAARLCTLAWRLTFASARRCRACGITASSIRAGGSADCMTLAIGHREKDVVVVDAVREVRPPFSPEDVVTEFCATLKSYRVTKVTGDRYGGEWPREQFRKQGVVYELSEQPKSVLYQSMLPLLNSRRIDLLDHPRLINQLCGLERRTARGGRDSIDHAPGGHDDIGNCVAGLCAIAAKDSHLANYTSYDWVLNDPLDRPAADPAAARERERAEDLGRRREAAHAAAAAAGGVHVVSLVTSPPVGPPAPRMWRSPYWR